MSDPGSPRAMRPAETARYRARSKAPMASVLRIAKAVYGWLLRILPPAAGSALRRLVARGRDVLWQVSGAVRPSGPARSEALVPIPVHGTRSVDDAVPSPAVMLIAYGLDATALEELVDELGALQERLQQGLRVLVVTDCDAFHVFRRRSLLFEYLPSRTEWEKGGFDEPYDAFRQARFAELFHVYAPDRIVHVTSADDLRGLPTVLFTET